MAPSTHSCPKGSYCLCSKCILSLYLKPPHLQGQDFGDNSQTQLTASSYCLKVFSDILQPSLDWPYHRLSVPGLPMGENRTGIRRVAPTPHSEAVLDPPAPPLTPNPSHPDHQGEVSKTACIFKKPAEETSDTWDCPEKTMAVVGCWALVTTREQSCLSEKLEAKDAHQQTGLMQRGLETKG